MNTFEYEEPNAFSEALMSFIDDEANERRKIRLDNDLYERSSE